MRNQRRLTWSILLLGLLAVLLFFPGFPVNAQQPQQPVVGGPAPAVPATAVVPDNRWLGIKVSGVLWGSSISPYSTSLEVLTVSSNTATATVHVYRSSGGRLKTALNEEGVGSFVSPEKLMVAFRKEETFTYELRGDHEVWATRTRPGDMPWAGTLTPK